MLFFNFTTVSWSPNSSAFFSMKYCSIQLYVSPSILKGDGWWLDNGEFLPKKAIFPSFVGVDTLSGFSVFGNCPIFCMLYCFPFIYNESLTIFGGGSGDLGSLIDFAAQSIG